MIYTIPLTFFYKRLWVFSASGEILCNIAMNILVIQRCKNRITGIIYMTSYFFYFQPFCTRSQKNIEYLLIKFHIIIITFVLFQERRHKKKKPRLLTYKQPRLFENKPYLSESNLIVLILNLTLFEEPTDTKDYILCTDLSSLSNFCYCESLF